MTGPLRKPSGLLVILAIVMVVVLAASIRYGAIDFSIGDIAAAFRSLLPGGAEPTTDQRIFLELRLPRAILGLLVGASLGVGGTLMQALFLVITVSMLVTIFVVDLLYVRLDPRVRREVKA